MFRTDKKNSSPKHKMASFEVLPMADSEGSRMKPRTAYPKLVPVPQASPTRKPEIPLNPLPERIPFFHRVIGMPPAVPKSHLAAMPYIG